MRSLRYIARVRINVLHNGFVWESRPYGGFQFLAGLLERVTFPFYRIEMIGVEMRLSFLEK